MCLFGSRPWTEAGNFTWRTGCVQPDARLLETTNDFDWGIQFYGERRDRWKRRWLPFPDDGDDENESGSSDRYSKMVKPIHIANEIGEWIKQPHLRPHPGSLVKVIAKNRKDGTGGAAFHLVR